MNEITGCVCICMSKTSYHNLYSLYRLNQMVKRFQEKKKTLLEEQVSNMKRERPQEIQNILISLK